MEDVLPSQSSATAKEVKWAGLGISFVGKMLDGVVVDRQTFFESLDKLRPML